MRLWIWTHNAGHGLVPNHAPTADEIELVEDRKIRTDPSECWALRAAQPSDEDDWVALTVQGAQAVFLKAYELGVIPKRREE